jgi:hypothetical protein
MDTVKQVGVVTANILNNAFGYVTATGIVRGIDTDGLGEGNLLYVSASVAGALTATPPTSPNYRAPVAYVVNDHASNGSIFVFRETATIGAADVTDYFRGDETWQDLNDAITNIAIQVFNVLEYGAVCDGVTDDSAAIQSAIDAAAGNGQVYIPPERCLCSSPLLLPDDTEIVGSGWNSTLVFDWTDSGTGPTAYYISNTNTTSGSADRIQIKNLTIEGAGTGAPAGDNPAPEFWSNGFIFWLGSDVEISDVHFYRIPGIAANTRGTSRVRMTNNLMFESGRDGITVQSYNDQLTTDIIITNNTIFRVGDDSIAISNIGNVVTRTSRVVVADNTIVGWDSVQVEAIGGILRLAGVEDFSVTGNVVDFSGGTGITIIQDNEWASSGLDSRNGVVANNVVRRSGYIAEDAEPHGISIVSVSNIVVSNNTISEVGSSGIYVAGVAVANGPPAFNIDVIGNVVVDGFGAVSDSGILLVEVEANQLTNVTVRGNIIQENNGGGLRIEGGSQILAENNLIVDNGNAQASGTDQLAAGIYTRSAGNANASRVIRNNKIIDTRGGSAKQTYGIVFASQGTAIGEVAMEGNHLFGNQTDTLLVSLSPTIFKRANNWLDSSVLSFNVYNGLDLEDAGTRPTCDSGTRGILWIDEGTAGVADTFAVCSKDDADDYAWVSTPDGAIEFTNKILNDLSNEIDADGTHAGVRNSSGSQIDRGEVVYISGYNIGQDLVEVELADNDDAAKMPAFCMMEADVANNATGHCVKSGQVRLVDTSGMTVGDGVWVDSTAGAFVNVKPTGTTEKVQKIGLVTRVHASLGIVELIGAGRTNDIPNAASPLQIYDDTPTTGASRLSIRAGAGDAAGDLLFTIYENDGTTAKVWVNAAGSILNREASFRATSDGTTIKALMSGNTASSPGFGLASDSRIWFRNNVHWASGAIDLSLVRLSAGVLKVADATTGYGEIDAGAYHVSGAAGVTATCASGMASMTVTAGIITAIVCN